MIDNSRLQSRRMSPKVVLLRLDEIEEIRYKLDDLKLNYYENSLYFKADELYTN